jgi:hypothetical protein
MYCDACNTQWLSKAWKLSKEFVRNSNIYKLGARGGRSIFADASIGESIIKQ